MKTINKNVSRRNFLRVSGMTGAVLTIGYYMPASGKDVAGIISGNEADNMGISLNAFISIDTSGKVTIMNHLKYA